MSLMGNFQRSQDTLWSLASDTGGKALLDYNDLSRGIRQAQQSISSYYIIGYYTTESESRRQIPAHQSISERRAVR